MQQFVLDATTGQMIDANAFKDANGNIVPPEGYCFVEATYDSAPVLPVPQQYINPYPGYAQFEQPEKRWNRRPSGPRNPKTPRPANSGKQTEKQELIHSVRTKLIEMGNAEKVYVTTRKETGTKFTLRYHCKTKAELAKLNDVMTQVFKEVGMAEFSMHYIFRQKSSSVIGLTLYMRFNESEEDLADASEIFEEFGITKVHRVGVKKEKKDGEEPPKQQAPEPKKKTKVHPSQRSKSWRNSRLRRRSTSVSATNSRCILVPRNYTSLEDATRTKLSADAEEFVLKPRGKGNMMTLKFQDGQEVKVRVNRSFYNSAMITDKPSLAKIQETSLGNISTSI